MGGKREQGEQEGVRERKSEWGVRGSEGSKREQGGARGE